MNVLVLGSTGMLGGMVFHYLKNHSSLNVIGTSRKDNNEYIKFDAMNGIDTLNLNLGEIDYIINCIGIIKPYCNDKNMSEVKKAININSLFPFELLNSGMKNEYNVIQIATDCVFSGSEGDYTEESLHDPLDVYGKTKSLGEVLSGKFLNIRCSIIGPEKYNKVSLLEWYLSQNDNANLKGFTHHLWNGITTLQFAELCEFIILNEEFDNLVNESNLYHFAPNNTVNKYELLLLFKEVFNKNTKIEKYSSDQGKVYRTLSTKYKSLNKLDMKSTLKIELLKLRNYIKDNNYYKTV